MRINKLMMVGAVFVVTVLVLFADLLSVILAPSKNVVPDPMAGRAPWPRDQRIPPGDAQMAFHLMGSHGENALVCIENRDANTQTKNGKQLRCRLGD